MSGKAVVRGHPGHLDFCQGCRKRVDSGPEQHGDPDEREGDRVDQADERSAQEEGNVLCTVSIFNCFCADWNEINALEHCLRHEILMQQI